MLVDIASVVLDHDTKWQTVKASTFCLAFSVDKLLCACLVLFAKFTTTVFR